MLFRKDHRATVWRIITIYVLCNGLWLGIFSVILGQPASIPPGFNNSDIVFAFISLLFNSVILYFLIDRYTRNLERDISELAKAEKEASLYKTLIEYTRDPVYILDPKDSGKMVYANQAACFHYGKPLEELLTMRISDWDPDFDITRIGPILEEMKQGKSIRFETRHRVASGRVVPVEVTVNRLIYDGRELSAGYFYDISERKTMEAALKESEARYRVLSQEFQALLDCVPDGLTLISPDFRILWLNAVSGNIINMAAEEQIGRHCYEVRHGFDAPCTNCLVRDTFMTGEPGCVVKTVGNPPNEHTLELQSVPIKDECGHVVKVFQVGRDMTEQKKAEAERLELERKLLHARKLESLGVLAGGIAHDFNNILTGILGNLSLVRVCLPEDHVARNRLGRCETAAKQATGLTQQLLTFARGGEPVKKIIDPAPVIENGVRFALRGSRVASEVSISDHLWPIDADEAQIGQVINNLLINADQAMPHGGLVRVEAVNSLVSRNEAGSLGPGPYVRISVSDQGTGIPPENLDMIFDPYFSTKSSGTGLGLTSVYSIVQKHGGEILVRSQVGKGSTFVFYLPALLEINTPADTSLPRSISRGKGLILVMDDEEIIRVVAAEMLSLLGYRVETCSCGEEVVKLYRKAIEKGERPFAVIMDLTVPGKMGGLEAASLIRENDPVAVLVVSSGYSSDPILAHHLEYGFCNVLVKPFQVEDMGAVLTEISGLKATGESDYVPVWDRFGKSPAAPSS
ncbi:MAG TPA: ATP-binding protein [Geobacteraceae bacterium]|nr:ATP-binding protein [Geobacteraceae bacterium]